jgi:acetylglutamate kinase
VKAPAGFSFAGMNAGIKATRKDLALIVSDAPCAAAGSFTVNAARAPSVADAARRLPTTGVRAVVCVSGNANALTGAEGQAHVARLHAKVGAALGCGADAVLSAATGVIGVPLPIDKLEEAVPRLAALLQPEVGPAAEAILTTDTRVKLASRTLRLGDAEVTVCALAKGSGMIAPELATLLAFITTDAAVTPAALKRALDRAVDGSFANLVVDGDMSTNDMVLALANGRSGAPLIDETSPALEELTLALSELCVELARAVAEDGEGATKLLEVTVSGAPDDATARALGRAVASSSLVKAALFGADPNWGRVLAAVGAYVGKHRLPIDPTRATVRLGGVTVFAGGPTRAETRAVRARLREPEVRVEVALAESGRGTATAWGCDLSYDYVKINADYAAMISASPEGVVAKDDRLANYSPAFKRALVVEALSYISRFSGTRAVVKYGGAAMVKDSLKASFAADVNLLRSAGLLPLVVHSGGPEITATMEKLGAGKGEFVGGMRVTNDEDLKVVEMVLTGRVNTELVSLLNQERSDAIGVSGKDGGLLRARKWRGERGEDLGRVGEITSVNVELLEMLLSRRYIPVISPMGLGDDGQGYNLNADAAAAEVAVAVKAEKLIYLCDAPGLVDEGELVSELGVAALRERLERGRLPALLLQKAQGALRALGGGVQRVHLVDGRTPHNLIAELFTDRGAGTLITP